MELTRVTRRTERGDMLEHMSVVIPAHNEEAVIGRLLRRLVDTDVDERLDIVVVANGCTDRTVEVATEVSNRVHVIAIDQASKPAALNAGDFYATTFPRAYVDADVMVTADALLQVADSLSEQGPLVGAPRLEVDAHGCHRSVRGYFRIWEESDYRRSGLVGSGLYVLTTAGRARFHSFPDIIADDLFVLRHFAADERLSLVEQSFVTRAPKDFVSLIRRQTRIAAGNIQLRQAFPSISSGPASSQLNLVKRVVRRPSLWPSVPAYVIGYSLPRLRAYRDQRRGRLTAWNRDETSREGLF